MQGFTGSEATPDGCYNRKNRHAYQNNCCKMAKASMRLDHDEWISTSRRMNSLRKQ
jgi:hypothetical protein